MRQQALALGFRIQARNSTQFPLIQEQVAYFITSESDLSAASRNQNWSFVSVNQLHARSRSKSESNTTPSWRLDGWLESGNPADMPDQQIGQLNTLLSALTIGIDAFGRHQNQAFIIWRERIEDPSIGKQLLQMRKLCDFLLKIGS
ncbi:MAG: hypothetical protein ACR2PW_08630 [Gammaproteobacteria bacterium]